MVNIILHYAFMYLLINNRCRLKIGKYVKCTTLTNAIKYSQIEENTILAKIIKIVE